MEEFSDPEVLNEVNFEQWMNSKKIENKDLIKNTWRILSNRFAINSQIKKVQYFIFKTIFFFNFFFLNILDLFKIFISKRVNGI